MILVAYTLKNGIVRSGVSRPLDGFSMVAVTTGRTDSIGKPRMRGAETARISGNNGCMSIKKVAEGGVVGIEEWTERLRRISN